MSHHDDKRLLISRVEDALARSIQAHGDPSSDLATSDFVSNFGDRLKLHWVLTQSQMTKSAFEIAFIQTLNDMGQYAERTSNQVYPGADARWEQWRISLKSEAALALDPRFIHISKFSEARWIRECRSGNDFAAGTIKLFEKHLNDYDRIFTLRSWKEIPEEIHYSLVEIPWNLLNHATALKGDSFSPRTRAGSSSAKVLDDEDRVLFTVVLDGSVEKVTLRKLSVRDCIEHATWNVPTDIH